MGNTNDDYYCDIERGNENMNNGFYNCDDAKYYRYGQMLHKMDMEENGLNIWHG